LPSGKAGEDGLTGNFDAELAYLLVVTCLLLAILLRA
jgi:hypothetical protein